MVLPIAATVVTSFRLFVRTRQRRLWLDDAWAALAMVFDIILAVVGWLYLYDHARFPQDTRVALYYLCILFTNQQSQHAQIYFICGVDQSFYAVIWLSRISILFTVVRLTFPGSLRRWLIRTAVAFAVTWMILGAQIFWTCETAAGWKMQPLPRCDMGKNVAIAQIIAKSVVCSIMR